MAEATRCVPHAGCRRTRLRASVARPPALLRRASQSHGRAQPARQPSKAPPPLPLSAALPLRRGLHAGPRRPGHVCRGSSLRLPTVISFATHNGERVADAKARLEVERGPERGQSPVDHDGDAVAEHVSLLHGVRGQHDGAVARGAVPPDDVPCEATGVGVHTTRGLVLEDG